MPAPNSLQIAEFYGEVDVYGGYVDLTDEPTTFHRARINVLGDSIALLVRDVRHDEYDEDGNLVAQGSKRYKQFDRIETAVLETGERDRLTFTGTSQRLVEELGLDVADAQVRWVLTKQRCATC